MPRLSMLKMGQNWDSIWGFDYVQELEDSFESVLVEQKFSYRLLLLRLDRPYVQWRFCQPKIS